MKKLFKLFVCSSLIILISSLAQAAVLEVRPSGGVSTLGDVYPTIQDAIDDASPGDTIIVHAGLYTENIDINKWLILEGDGDGNNPAVDTIITAAVGDHPTVQIQAGGASETDRLIIRNLRVTGATGSGNPGSGIELDTDSSFVTIESVTITGNEGHGLNADVMGLIGDLQVIDCNLSGNDGAGLNQNSYVSIDGLIITDCNVNNNANGLYLEGPLTALTLSGGSFNNNLGGGTSGVGIYATRINDFLVQKTVSLSNFTANGNKRGLIFNKFYGPFSISDAVISDNLEEGLVVAPGASVSDPITFTNVTVENNPKWNLWFISYLGHAITDVTLNNVTATGSTDASNGYGIYLYASTGSTLSNVTITDCLMSGNNNGLYLRAYNETSTVTNVNISDSDIISNVLNGILITDYAAAGNKINNSQIAGNGFGISNLDPDDVFDATLNCWSDATGPYHLVKNPGGLGDEISDNVSYYPWYLDCTMTTTVSKRVHNITIDSHYDDIQPAIDDANEGNKICVDLGTYNESVDIYKNDLTIEGEIGSMPLITGGLILNTDVTGLTLKNFEISGNAVAGKNTIVRMYGAITDLTIDNCVFDGQNVAERTGFTGGQLEGDVSVTNCEFKNILGWAVFESRSGSGGDGSDMGTVTFANNNVHNCNGSVVFRGLSTDRTDVVNIYGNTFNDIGGNEGQQGQHWAAIEINRTVLANVYNNDVNGVLEGEWTEGQALQVWDIDTLDVHDNNFVNNHQGIWVYGSDPAYGGSISIPGGSIYCNNISGNSDYGISVDTDALGGPLDAENNWWGDASGPSGNGGGAGDAVYGNVDFFPWLLSDDCGDFTIEVADYVVDDDWVGLPDWTTVNVGGTDYYIGLNAFDTIQEAVDAATDGNNISVLEGQYFGAVIDEDLSIIGANPGGSVITDGPHYGGGVAGLKTAFKLDSGASGTELKNFTIDCNSADNFFFAIFSRAADDVVVDSLAVNNPVQGITNYGGSGWQITNNLINYTEASGGGGIAIYLGAYPPDYVVLQDNVVKGNAIISEATAPTYTCPGIAMCLDLRYGRYDLLTGNEDISYNMIVQNDIVGTGLDSEVGIEIGVIGLESDPNKIAATLGLIHDNTVRDNIVENTDWGIYFYTVADLRILGNKIVDCNDGIHIEDSHYGVVINFNSIYGNASYGLNNTGSEVVDATYNFWGDVSGPNDPVGTSETDGGTCYDVSVIKNADGLGNAVTNENVEYCPWLLAPPIPSNSLCPLGDLDGDCDVDFVDLAIFANNWLVGTEE